MDASFALAGLIEAYGGLLEDKDFLGAEQLLTEALGACRLARAPDEAVIHFYFGKLYREWDKMSSAVNHLSMAAELAAQSSDRLFLIQVVEELKLARKYQAKQRP